MVLQIFIKEYLFYVMYYLLFLLTYIFVKYVGWNTFQTFIVSSKNTTTAQTKNAVALTVFNFPSLSKINLFNLILSYESLRLA
jgi:hypothetical protein